MDAILFIGIVIIVIILLGIKSSIQKSTEAASRDINSLNKKLLEIKAKLETLSSNPIAVTIDTDKEEQAKQKAIVEAQAMEEQRIRLAELEKIRQQNEAKKREEERLLQQRIAATPIEERIAAPIIEPAIVNTYEPTESWWEKWVRNNPDLEKFIGENLINKIGIAVLVLGIAFFVKYAIDQNWIKEWGRVSIGIGCGAILIGIAHYLRNNYRSFSSVLVGGGLAVFYFTIAFAYHQYALIGQTPAFIIMIVITIFAVLLALLYDKLEVAVVAAIGGFITPFLVSNGEGNYMALFIYLIILNVGLLTLSYFKKWPLLNILSLFFTIIIFGSWMIKVFAYGEAVPPYKNAILFATVFYALFLSMNMIHNIRFSRPFKAFDFFILLLINCSFYSAGMIILTHWHNGDFKGLFTICIGAVNFSLAFYFYKTHKGDKNLLYLLIGLTLSFISLAAPVQLHGHSITLFWSAEAVLLYWLYQRSAIRIFKYSSALVTILMLISLMMDWTNANWNNSLQLSEIFTGIKGIVTNLVATASFIAYYFLVRKENGEDEYIFGIKISVVQIIMPVIAIVLLYVTAIFSINLYYGNQPDYTRVNSYYLLITDLFAIAIVLVIQKLNVNLVWLQIGLAIACYFVFVSSSGVIIDLRDRTLAGLYPSSFYIVHWISDICLLWLAFKVIQLVRYNSLLTAYTQSASWMISIALIVFFSLEITHLYVSVFYYNNNITYVEMLFQKAGLTILWAVCSFVLMWLGMKHKYKTVRIISLTLFSVALLKLFLYDISDVSEGGKIAAFIMLGVLLLTISFMYQKLKKIIIDDKAH